MKKTPRIALLVPCYNEELTVAEVVREFRAELPHADIYVFDNNSSDKTVEKAREAGAIVMFEKRQGKGFVVQSMFQRVDADFYIMVDGDSTYPAKAVHTLLEPALSGEADMVVGSRLTKTSQSEFKVMNRFGNWLFLSVLNWIFNVKLTDILSGYRVFSRRFVKNLALFGQGFEIETELTIKALERRYSVVEVPCDLGVRPEGSHSKIRHFRDGLLILQTIMSLFRDFKPLTFFGLGGLALIGLGFWPGALVTLEYLRTGQVLRIPSAILAVGLVVTGMLGLMVGLILHTVVRRFRDLDYHIRVLSEEMPAGRPASGPEPGPDAREPADSTVTPA